MVAEKPWQPEAVWRLGWGLFASYFLGLILIGMGLGRLTGWSQPNLQLLQFMTATVTFHGAALALIWLFLDEIPLSVSEAFGFASPGLGRAFRLALAASVVVIVVAPELSWLSGEIMMSCGLAPEVQTAVEILQTTVSWKRQIIYGGVAIVLAPTAEELLFRGILYPTIKQMGHPKLALWGTSLFFAVIHMNLMTLVPLCFIAVMLTLLYEETNNLLAPILAHSLFNAANFLMVIFEPNISQLITRLHERI